MKGLIFKEIYISRKRCYISAATYISLLIMCILVKLSAVHGNLRLLDAEAVRHVENVTFYLAVFGLLIAMAGVVVNNAETDKITRWDIFRRTIPFTEKQIVGAVYISNAITLGIALAVHTLVSLVVCTVFDIKFEPWFLSVFLAFCLLVYLINAFSLFCQYRFRDPKRAKLVYSAVLFVIYFGICIALYAALAMTAPGEDPVKTEKFLKDTGSSILSFIKNYSWVIPAVCAALTAVLFFVSVRACKRPADDGKPPKQNDDRSKRNFFRKLRTAAEGDDN